MYREIVRHVPLFARLPEHEIESIASCLQEQRFTAGWLLFREGEVGDKFYIVLQGRIAVIKGMDQPSEQVLRICKDGDLVGEMSLFDRNGLRTASAWVEVDSHVLVMTRQGFEMVLSRQPAIAYEMVSLLSRRLNDVHERAIHDLREKGQRLAEAYDELRAAQSQIVEKELLERELLQARDLQRNMLPLSLPSISGYELGARMVPARLVGGDFYDVIRLDENRLGIAVGDVAGKGIPAAMFMALSCSLLRAEARASHEPLVVLQRVNQHLLAMNPRGIFVTVLYGVLHCAERRFDFVRAGHEYPLLWRRDGSPAPVEHRRSQLLGLLETPVLETQSLALPAGSTLLLFSDGVTEAQDEQAELIGEQGIRAMAPELLPLGAQEMCDRVIDILSQCCFKAQKSGDDITLVALKTL